MQFYGKDGADRYFVLPLASPGSQPRLTPAKADHSRQPQSYVCVLTALTAASAHLQQRPHCTLVDGHQPRLWHRRWRSAPLLPRPPAPQHRHCLLLWLRPTGGRCGGRDNVRDGAGGGGVRDGVCCQALRVRELCTRDACACSWCLCACLKGVPALGCQGMRCVRASTAGFAQYARAACVCVCVCAKSGDTVPACS